MLKFEPSFSLKTYKTESPIRTGLNDSGILSFGEDNGKIDAMIREEIQNSLDARYSENNNEPTIVKFDIFDIQTSEIPCLDDFKKEIENCKIYSAKRTSEDHASTKFLQNMYNTLSKQKIKILRVSDFNDSGLYGVNGINTPYDNLIKARGISDKTSGASGSFGLGKDAAFAMSNIRTVFYSSNTKNDESYSIGMAKLPGYEYKNENYTGDLFFSDKCGNPVTFKFFGKEPRKREECGLDKYIIGIDADIEKDFAKTLIKSVVKNFLVSIYLGKLIVEYKDVKIQKETIETYINKHKDEIDPIALKQYEAIISPTFETTISIFEEDDVKIYFKEEAESTHRKVGIYRLSGMKIFDKGGFSSSINFNSVMILRGRKVNDYFKQFENPEHTKWLNDIINKTPGGKDKNRELFEPIREQIKEIQNSRYSDSLTIEGLEEYLPVYFSDKKKKTKTTETLSNKIKSDKKRKKRNNSIRTLKRNFNFITKTGEKIEAEIIEFDNEKNPGKVVVNIFDKDKNLITKEMNVKDFKTFEKDNKYIKPKLSRAREIPDDEFEIDTFCEKGIYHLFIKPIKNIKNGYIEVKLVGETGSVFETKIKKAFSPISNENLLTNENTILLKDISKDKFTRIDFELEETERFTIEVYVYEN